MSDDADLDLLEARLVSMRNGLVARLAKRVEGGDLALLASVGGALAALDRHAPEGGWLGAGRGAAAG